jgi:hypothetical protein
MSATPRQYVSHNVRVTLSLLGSISSAMEHAIQFSDGGSEQNEIDMADWTSARAEVRALINEIRAEEKIDNLVNALTRLLKFERDSQSDAVDLIKELTGKEVKPNYTG